MSKVFISYSHDDANTADDLASALSALDIPFFRDVKHIKWGDSITSEVRHALDQCTAILVIVSPASLRSHWVPYEIGHASAQRKVILPFLTHPSLDVPPYIRDLKYLTNVDEVRQYFTEAFPQQAKKVPTLTETPSSSRHQITLSDLQVRYLTEISRPRNEGSIYGGLDERTGRDAARYQEAIELFQAFGLMRYTGGAYKLTSKGWHVADQLWALRILDALDFTTFIDHNRLAEAVELTDGQTELDELKRHIDALEKGGLVKVNRNMHGWSVRILEQGITHRKRRSVEL